MRDLTRVYDNIAGCVLEFCSGVSLDTFHAKDLVQYVQERYPVAPNSPCRILQILKKEGKINYEVLSRSQSLYRMLSKEKEVE